MPRFKGTVDNEGYTTMSTTTTTMADTIDYLSEDPVLPEQKFACLSVFTPESLECFKEQNGTNRQAYQDIVKELQTLLKDDAQKIAMDKLCQVVDTLLDTRRSLKIRGVYATMEEAQKRCEKIREYDRYFHVFVGEVGKWLPWEDDPEKAKDAVYAEKQLNALMKSYHEEQERCKVYHEQRKNDMIAAALKENERKKVDAAKTKKKGNVGDAINKRFEEKKTKLDKEGDELVQEGQVIQRQQDLLEKLRLESEAISAELNASDTA